MDECDMASIAAEKYLSGAIAAMRERRLPAGCCGDSLPEAGAPGVCVDCGGEIPEGRIRAVPGATRCIDCQIAFEEM